MEIQVIPKLKDWTFPYWIIGVCTSASRFDEAREIIIKRYGLVPSPVERGRDDQALVFPIAGINLEERFRGDYDTRFGGWGIGRARFDKKFRENRGGPSFEFKYFADDCPWEHIKTDPMREAVIVVSGMLKPFKFLDAFANEIDYPY